MNEALEGELKRRKRAIEEPVQLESEIQELHIRKAVLKHELEAMKHG